MFIYEDFIKYISGYIDGDGCFRMNTTIQKSGMIVYERSITILSTKKDVIYMFKKFFGGFIVIKNSHENYKKAYIWTIKGNNAFVFAKNIYPFLVLKKQECCYFINFCENIYPNNFKKVSENILKIRNNLIFLKRIETHQNNLVNFDEILKIKKIKNTINPTYDDFIYLSGLIDAEGCLRISYRNRIRNNKIFKIYNIVLEIGNSKITIIEWLIKRFGGSITFCKNEEIENRKPFSIWSIHSKSLYKILQIIVKYLINKKEVCIELINFQKTILENGGDRHSIKFKNKMFEIHQIREKIIEKVHKLNHKGN